MEKYAHPSPNPSGPCTAAREIRLLTLTRFSPTLEKKEEGSAERRFIQKAGKEPTGILRPEDLANHFL